MSGIDEFEQLVLKAEKQLGDTLYIERNDKGTWKAIKDGPDCEDIYDATFAEVVAKLKEWAKPKKPDAVTITLPYNSAKGIADRIWCTPHGIAVNAACREAIKPYED